MGEQRFLLEDGLNTCYCDESGTGDNPIATMVGIIVDSGRMHLTKPHWRDLLATLSEMTSRPISELHAVDFYHGNGVWRGVDGPQRTLIINAVLEWFGDRKHHVVYTSALKSSYAAAVESGGIPTECKTLWQLIAFHLVLAVQRYSQPEKRNKGHTVLQFDDNSVERGHFIDLVYAPPEWSDVCYGRTKEQDQLDQIVDMPNFSDSKKLPLIQVADFLAFFLRRYAELEEGYSEEQYEGERERIRGWAKQIADRSIARTHVYPKAKRNEAQEYFYRLAPASIREL